MRAAFPALWFRVHTLPHSKRYPDTAAEHDEIHRRHGAVASALFRPAEPVWVVVPTEVGVAEAPDLEWIGSAWPSYGESEPITLWIATSTWDLESTLRLRDAAVQDRTRAVWVSQRTLEVFAPYDGGVDVIAADGTRRDQLSHRFASWRSARPDGL